jgi:hypothetical protein
MLQSEILINFFHTNNCCQVLTVDIANFMDCHIVIIEKELGTNFQYVDNKWWLYTIRNFTLHI